MQYKSLRNKKYLEKKKAELETYKQKQEKERVIVQKSLEDYEIRQIKKKHANTKKFLKDQQKKYVITFLVFFIRLGQRFQTNRAGKIK